MTVDFWLALKVALIYIVSPIVGVVLVHLLFSNMARTIALRSHFLKEEIYLFPGMISFFVPVWLILDWKWGAVVAAAWAWIAILAKKYRTELEQATVLSKRSPDEA